MPTVQQILDALEAIAPARFAYAFDRIGLQVGDPSARVDRAVIAMDRSLAAIRFAAESSSQLLLCHHPLIWEPLGSVRTDSYEGKAVGELIAHGISFVAAHTNWDCAIGGINDILAAKLELTDVRPFGTATAVSQVKLVAFAPEESSRAIVEAAAQAGAGRIGLYSRCAFLSSGTGTFLPGEGAHPAVGKVGEVETASETRIEMILPRKLQASVERAVRSAHPYEEPAIDFLQVSDLHEQPIGRMGVLKGPCALRELAALVDQSLHTRCWTWGDPDLRIESVAVCGGAADDEWQNAKHAGADALVTGEVKQHIGLEASESGFALVAAGHFATEHPGSAALRGRLAEVIGDVEWLVFEPKPGFSGRPS